MFFFRDTCQFLHCMEDVTLMERFFFISFEQETYPSTPPVWFAESEEISITNAVQILSTTEGQNNHVLNQVSLNIR